MWCHSEFPKSLSSCQAEVKHQSKEPLGGQMLNSLKALIQKASGRPNARFTYTFGGYPPPPPRQPLPPHQKQQRVFAFSVSPRPQRQKTVVQNFRPKPFVRNFRPNVHPISFVQNFRRKLSPVLPRFRSVKHEIFTSGRVSSRPATFHTHAMGFNDCKRLETFR